MLGIHSWGDVGGLTAAALFVAGVIGGIARWMIVKPLEVRIAKNGSAHHAQLRIDIKSDVHKEIAACRDELKGEMERYHQQSTESLRHHVQDMHRGKDGPT